VGAAVSARPAPGRPGNSRRARSALLLVLLAAGLAAAVLLAVGAGAVRVPPSSLLRLGAYHLGFRALGLPPAQEATILLLIRLPRVASALLVGAALAAGGVVMQGLFRNPMASPDILGVSTGASLGAVAAIATGLAGSSPLMLPALAVAGALAASFLIYAVSSFRGKTSLLFVVLAGLAISSFFNGLVSAILLFARQYEVSQFIFWTMGGLEGRTWRQVLLALPVLAPGLAVMGLFARPLNLLALGEEGAQSLGLGVEPAKRVLLAVTAAVAGVAISISGPVGFVGLLIPHLFRLLVGPDHRVLLPASILGGALFLVLCDLAGRALVPPFEIRVGIITAVLGSPYFLFLILRAQRKGLRHG
jgi:iron complex transport system permease protein